MWKLKIYENSNLHSITTGLTEHTAQEMFSHLQQPNSEIYESDTFYMVEHTIKNDVHRFELEYYEIERYEI